MLPARAMLTRNGLRGGVLRSGFNANARQVPRMGKRFQSTVRIHMDVIDRRMLEELEAHNLLLELLAVEWFFSEVCPFLNLG
jgi:hypothetical protein